MLLWTLMLAVQDAQPTAPPAAVLPPADKARPITDPGSWIRWIDYPPEALRNNETGAVAFRLDVDATGAVTACTVTQGSGSALLDTATCALMRERARFTPARDKTGRAVADSFSSRVRWQLPPPDTRTLASTVRVVRISVGGDGKMTQCVVDARYAEDTPPPRPCEAGDFPPEQLMAGLARRTTGPFELIAYVDMHVLGTTPAPPFMVQPGYVTTARFTFQFDVNPAGKMQNCRETGRDGPPGPPPPPVCTQKELFSRLGEKLDAKKTYGVRFTLGFLTSAAVQGRPRD